MKGANSLWNLICFSCVFIIIINIALLYVSPLYPACMLKNIKVSDFYVCTFKNHFDCSFYYPETSHFNFPFLRRVCIWRYSIPFLPIFFIFFMQKKKKKYERNEGECLPFHTLVQVHFKQIF